MGPKSTLRLIRTLGPSLASLAQSTWSFSIQCPCGVGLHQDGLVDLAAIDAFLAYHDHKESPVVAMLADLYDTFD